MFHHEPMDDGTIVSTSDICVPVIVVVNDEQLAGARHPVQPDIFVVPPDATDFPAVNTPKPVGCRSIRPIRGWTLWVLLMISGTVVFLTRFFILYNIAHLVILLLKDLVGITYILDDGVKRTMKSNLA
jgi:hypothetical protein